MVHCEPMVEAVNAKFESCLKSEKNSSSPSIQGELEERFKCAGCGLLILDKFYLLALDRRWHAQCLKCSECDLCLDSQVSCFSKNGRIFCKHDYFKSISKCSRCSQGILPPDLVIRLSSNHLYHVQCFTCIWCNVILTQGDYFGSDGQFIFCKTHFIRSQLEGRSNDTQHFELHRDPVAVSDCCSSPDDRRGVLTSHHVSSGDVGPSMNMFEGTSSSPPATPPSPHHEPSLELEHVPVGRRGKKGKKATSQHAKKGSKKKSVNSNHNNNKTRDDDDDVNPGQPLDGQSLESNCLQMNDAATCSPSPSLSSNSNNNYTQGNVNYCLRSKRMRTSFKHHQLKQMKAYFSINHNPDSKELKALSLKTALPKRVLQVWFQNARAKWRRGVLRQDSNGPHIVSEATSLLDITQTNDSHFVNGGNHCWFPDRNLNQDENKFEGRNNMIEHYSLDSSSSTDILLEEQMCAMLH